MLSIQCFSTFSVLFSSVSCQCGQSNYCSTGTFLNAFNRYRHGRGLSASAIHVDVVEDVDYFVEIQPFYNNSRPTEFKPFERLISSILRSWPLYNRDKDLNYLASLQTAAPARAILDAESIKRSGKIAAAGLLAKIVVVQIGKIT